MQGVFDFHRRDVFPAGNNNVLEPVADLDIAIGMHHRQIARTEIAILEGGLCRLGILQVAFHDGVAAQGNFANGLTIAGNRLAGFGIKHGGIFGDGERHTLTRFQFGAGGEILIIPFALPDRHDGMTIGFGQPVNLGDVEPEAFNPLQDGGGRRCACGHDLNGVVERAAISIISVDDHAQHDGCAAKMRYAMISDGIIDRFRGHGPVADQGSRQRGDGKDMPPAVAVKQWHSIEIGKMARHLPVSDGPHGHEHGAAMMIDNALGPAAGPGGVVKGECIPFITGQRPFSLGVTAFKQGLIIHFTQPGTATGVFTVGNIDHRDAVAVTDTLERGLNAG